MGAWADSQGIGKDEILMLGDGNGDFTRQLGLSMDAKGFGMGERSQRYAMIVKDGVVEQLPPSGEGDHPKPKAKGGGGAPAEASRPLRHGANPRRATSPVGGGPDERRLHARTAQRRHARG